jgi:hypothetical protein
MAQFETKMRKLCTDEVGGVNRKKNERKKKKKKKRFLQFEKTYFLSCSFLTAHLAFAFEK